MDYLDPKKRLKQTILLFSGYIIIGAAIAIGTVILLYQAYGYGFRNGQVIQNGLLFFSSQPKPAQIYINGSLQKSTTNTSLILPAATYQVKLSRAGYRPWERTITVNGGTVEHFDYPLLFPITLHPKKVISYPSAPAIETQSPNQRWLLIARPALADSFDVFDLTNPTQAPTTVTIPSAAFTKPTVSDSWSVVAWADDNQHVLLLHAFDGKTEYVLFDWAHPEQSVNLSQALSGDTYTSLSLANRKYDQYFLYDAAAQTLSSASLNSPSAVSVVPHVLSYVTYDTNTFLYTTTDGAPAGKVLVKEQVGGQTYTIRSLSANTTYLLDYASYSGVPYAVIGASSENKVYVYQDPVGQLQSDPDHVPVPSQVLRVTAPNYVSFSNNAQFIVAENGQQFATYDLEYQHGYTYSDPHPLDAPQQHATWMDGDRLTYVSNGNVLVFDYDHANVQSLMPSNPADVPAFAPDYSKVFTVAPVPSAAAGTSEVLNTSLYLPSGP